MRLLKVVLPILWISLAAIPCQSVAEERISVLLRSVLDGGRVPTDVELSDALSDDYVMRLSQEDVKKFLPMAQGLLQDSRPEARQCGLLSFLPITLRSDSELLLEPYVPDLLRVAGDRKNPLRSVVFYILGNTAPKVSPKTVAYMAAHFADSENTKDDTVAMAAILLRAGSPPMIHDLIAFVRKQNKPDLTGRVISACGVYHVRNADTLALIDESLDSRDEGVSRIAVEAVESLPAHERTPFLAKLIRLSEDPDAPESARSAAARVLKK